MPRKKCAVSVVTLLLFSVRMSSCQADLGGRTVHCKESTWDKGIQCNKTGDSLRDEKNEETWYIYYIYIIYYIYLYRQLYSTVYRKLMEIQELCLHVFQHECWCVELKYCISGLVPRQKRIDRNVNFFPMHQIWWAWLGCCCPRAKLTKNCGVRKRTKYQKLRESFETSASPGSACLGVQTSSDCVWLCFCCSWDFRFKLSWNRVPWYWDTTEEARARLVWYVYNTYIDMMRTWYDIDMIFKYI